MIVVSKFGGSSLSCATQFEKVKNIVKSSNQRNVVVVSALGKRDKDDTKITDLLYILGAHLKYHVGYDDIWNMFYTRFVDVKKELNLKYDIEKDLNDLKSELTSHIQIDYLVSRGEYFTAKLISEYLGYTFVDAKDIISFNYDGRINYEVTEEKAKAAFEKYGKIIVPGFYGSFPNGHIKLLSRGGSDVTGSILAKSLNVSMYENWTDVSGVYAADPRIVSNPRSIPQITYMELRELSYMGANVLHEETIFPVQELQIPINIKNTNDPSNPGTIIKDKCEDTTHIITGIAGKKDFVSINVLKDHMSNEIGFLRKVLSIFEKYNVSIEHLPSGIDTISIVCSKDNIEKYLYEIVSDIKRELQAEVTFDDDLALLAVVGRNMAGKIGLCAKLFTILGDANINLKILAQGPSELNIIVGVSEKDYNKAIKEVYAKLIA